MHLRRHVAVAGAAAFSLVELMTVVVIIGILAAMVLGIATEFRRRADRALCVMNLKNLYVAANGYVQQNGHWPQVDYRLLQDEEERYAEGWVNALKPFGLAHINWLCPTVQREMNNPNLDDPRNMRIDYIASPFDNRPVAPYEYSNQPWFAERGDAHEDGPLVIFTNGQILSLRQIVPKRR